MDLREKYISPYYSSSPTMDKLAELFDNRGRKLFKLARYIVEGLKLYSWLYTNIYLFVSIVNINTIYRIMIKNENL